MKQLSISSFAAQHANKCFIFPLFLILFLIILGRNIGFAQGGFASCGTSANNPFPILPIPGEAACYPITQHPIFVRIKAHILRPSNAAPNTGQSPERVIRAIARMQANFEPFRIYFLWDACDINFIDNDDDYSSMLSETLNNLKVEYGASINEPNSIDIFFYPNDFITDELGSTINITSDVIGIGGKFTNLIPAIETNMLTHEMAHCLGLYHTNETNIVSPGSITCACEVYASQLIDECCACGDLVCDTKFYPDDLYTVEPNCSWLETATLPNCGIEFSNPETRNFMTNTNLVCTKRFTTGQGIRMRHVLTQAPLGVTQSNNATNLFTSLSIPSTNIPNVWTTGMFLNNQVIIYEDLTVESGSSLEIRAGVSVLFAREAKLIVQPNAILKLNGVLTGKCGDYWQGVKIYGKPGQTNQYPLNGVYAQGRMEGYEKGVIENAITAVELYGGGGNGGQINCKGTLFRNNQIGVSFKGYANNIPSIPQVEGTLTSAGNQNYKAHFNGCIFETNDNYPRTLHENKYFFYAFIDMVEVKGAQILSCSFANTKTEDCPNNSNTTCKGFGIRGILSGFTIDNAFGTNVGCTFTGLGEAVYVSSPPMISSLTRPVTIRSASFTDNYVGIYLENVLGASVTGNKFYLGNMPGNPTEKVQFGTIFAKSSEFVYTGNQFYKVDGNAETTVGTCNYDIGSANNVINLNKYSDIHIANVVNRNNNELPNNITSGLYYECNTNDGVTAYDFVMPNDADRIRTNQGKLVGIDPSNNSPIFLPAGNRFSHQGACDFSDFYKSTQNINYYYANPIMTGDPFQAPLDHNLNTTNLFSVKTMTTCSDFGYESLYQTREALNTIRNEYFAANNNFTKARKNWINATKPGSRTYIENTERVASLHYLTMYELAKKGFLHALHDTLNYSEDSLKAWQGRLWTYESDVRLALSYGFASQSTAAAQVIGQIPQRYVLSATQQAELSRIQTLIQIGSSQNLRKLDKNTQSILLQIAQDPNDGIAAQAGKGILSNYGYVFPLYSCSLPVCLEGKKVLLNSGSSAQVPEKLDIAVTPNPANDHILVQISKIGDRSGQFKIVGLWGQTVFQTTTQGNLSVQVNSGSFPAGIYFWVLTLADGTISQGRIIVQH